MLRLKTRLKKTRQNKKIERVRDSIQSERALAGFCITGAQHVLNNFTAGSYDTEIRASGVGMMLGVGRIGSSILGPSVVGLLQQATGSSDVVFWAIGCAVLVAACAIGSLGYRAADPSTHITVATVG
jgi:AAHS family 4-hydroxybenzoate transporter-like MFS transporter